MKEELLEQYRTLRYTDAVQAISLETSAGGMTITNKAVIDKVMDFLIEEAKRELAWEDARR